MNCLGLNRLNFQLTEASVLRFARGISEALSEGLRLVTD